MQEALDIGIDVAKAELVVGVAGRPDHDCVLANTQPQIELWLDQIPAGSRLAVESTGRYHAQLVDLAQARGLTVYVLNARDVHYYARALGQRGKTDRTDAQVISRYLHEHHAHLHPFIAGDPVAQQIDHLLQRRERIVVHHDALKRSLRELDGLQATATLLHDFEALLGVIDQCIAVLIASEPGRASAARLLRSIPGIGPLGSALLSGLFQRIPFTRSDAVVAFSGLDPRPLDSGQKRGRRRLSKRGSPLLRRTLFMAAFSASRSRVFKPFYQALRARGLASTEAFVILARKLLRIAFAVWKTQTVFEPTKYMGKIACAEL
jgi:transposase